MTERTIANYLQGRGVAIKEVVPWTLECDGMVEIDDVYNVQVGDNYIILNKWWDHETSTHLKCWQCCSHVSMSVLFELYIKLTEERSNESI
jgi:hypothetical protein